MVLLKFLIASFLASAPLVAEENLPSDGWFPVEQPEKQPVQEDEKDSTIWAIFVKNLGDEKILARFPEDPNYKYITPETIEISSTKNGERFQLWIQEIPQGDSFKQRMEEVLSLPNVQMSEADPEGMNLVYQTEGKWVQEHLLLTSHHLYLFQTTSLTPSSEKHEIFTQSFEIENNR